MKRPLVQIVSLVTQSQFLVNCGYWTILWYKVNEYDKVTWPFRQPQGSVAQGSVFSPNFFYFLFICSFSWPWKFVNCRLWHMKLAGTRDMRTGTKAVGSHEVFHNWIKPYQRASGRPWMMQFVIALSMHTSSQALSSLLPWWETVPRCLLVGVIKHFQAVSAQHHNLLPGLLPAAHSQAPAA